MATSLVDLLPAELRVEQPVIPAEQNAWGPLEEARRLFVGNREDLPSYWPPSDPRNEGFAGSEAEVRAVLAANEPALAKLDEALGRTYLEAPDILGPVERTQQVMAVVCRPLQKLFSVLHVRMQIELHESHLGSALVDINRMIDVCRLLSRGDKTSALLASCGLVTRTALGLRALAEQPMVEGSVLKELRDGTDRLRDMREEFSQSYRRELNHWTLAMHERMRLYEGQPLADQVAALVELIAGEDEAEPDLDDDEYILPSSRQAARREVLRGCLGYILRDHPHPYDERQTVEWFAADTRWAMLRVMQFGPTPWYRLRETWDDWRHTLKRRRMRRILGAWPGWIFRFLHPMSFDFADESAFPCADNWYSSLFEPIDEASLARARRSVQRIANPVGALVFHGLAPGSFDSSVRTSEASLGLTQLVIALRLHELEYGRLPKRLRDLVRAGILDELPIDPFTGGQFYYNAETATVWSAGDAEDASRGDEKPDDPIARRLAWQLAGHRVRNV